MLFGKPEWNIPIWRASFRLDDNIEVNLKEIECGLDLIGSG